LTRPFAWLAALALLELGGILQGAARFAAVGASPEPLAALLMSDARAASSTRRAPIRVDAILQRPLFAAGRAPFRPEQARPAAPASLPRLTGLVITEVRREAIFTAANGQKPLIVHEGDRLGTFTVTAIRTQEVELAGPLGTQTIRTAADAGLRSQFAHKLPVLAMIDPVRRERETESNQ